MDLFGQIKVTSFCFFIYSLKSKSRKLRVETYWSREIDKLVELIPFPKGDNNPLINLDFNGADLHRSKTLLYRSTLDLLQMPLVNENKWDGVGREVGWSLMIKLKLDFKIYGRRYRNARVGTIEGDGSQMKMTKLTLKKGRSVNKQKA